MHARQGSWADVVDALPYQHRTNSSCRHRWKVINHDAVRTGCMFLLLVVSSAGTSYGICAASEYAREALFINSATSRCMSLSARPRRRRARPPARPSSARACRPRCGVRNDSMHGSAICIISRGVRKRRRRPPVPPHGLHMQIMACQNLRTLSQVLPRRH
jgi:hypothetical protein